jgi:xylulokinase
MADLILAHDLGTSGDKATLYTAAGTRLGSATVAYPSNFFNGCWAEQAPDDWWRAVCASTKQLLAETKADPSDIAVVALSGQMMGCTPVDAKGNALRPSMLYCDQRAVAEADQIEARVGAEKFYGIVGHRVSASYSIEKLMWVKAREPEVYARTAKTLCAKDYVNLKLTGRMATDYSDASSTNAFDLNTFRWSEEILSAAEIPLDKMPEAVPSTAILGGVTAEAAEATGLLAGTPVAAGGGDGSCAGVGAGAVAPGVTYCCLGSSSWIGLACEKIIADPERRVMTWAHCVPGTLHATGTMQTAGSAIKWFVEKFGVDYGAAASVPPGANGLLFLPYLCGERTPWWNPDARGVFAGLNLASTKEEMYRAVLEGVAMSLAGIRDIFRETLDCGDTLRALGGGAQGETLLAILADACRCRVETVEGVAEATSTGAAVTGGVACGLFPDFTATERFVRTAGEIVPDALRTAFYAERRKLMFDTYRAMESIYAILAQQEKGTDK